MKKLACILAAVLCVLLLVMLFVVKKDPSDGRGTSLPTTTQPQQTTLPAETTSVPSTTEDTVPPTATTVPPTTVTPTMPPLETNISGVTAKTAFAYSYNLKAYTYLKGDLEADLYPASITKLFSAYMILQYLEPDQMVTVGSIIKTVPYDSSFAGLEEGDVISVSDLLHGMLMRSGGDAARVLAVEAGRVISGNSALSEENAMAVFVADMNEKGPSIGLVNSYFVTADGYHDKAHHTCLADIVTITRLCLEDPLLRKIFSTPTYSTTTAAGRQLDWFNTNYLVDPERGYYIPTAIGLKTGNTSAAGRCLVSAFITGDDITIIGVFGCTNREDHFINAHTIYNHFFS